MQREIELRHQAMVSGRLTPRHGHISTYVDYACRCDLCREANRAYQSQMRQNRRSRLTEMFDSLTHGSASTYKNWGCRCGPCTVANNVACRPAVRRYAERKRQAARR